MYPCRYTSYGLIREVLQRACAGGIFIIILHVARLLDSDKAQRLVNVCVRSVYLFVCVRVCLCVCIYTYIYIYIYIYACTLMYTYLAQYRAASAADTLIVYVYCKCA